MIFSGPAKPGWTEEISAQSAGKKLKEPKMLSLEGVFFWIFPAKFCSRNARDHPAPAASLPAATCICTPPLSPGAAGDLPVAALRAVHAFRAAAVVAARRGGRGQQARHRAAVWPRVCEWFPEAVVDGIILWHRSTGFRDFELRISKGLLFCHFFHNLCTHNFFQCSNISMQGTQYAGRLLHFPRMSSLWEGITEGPCGRGVCQRTGGGLLFCRAKKMRETAESCTINQQVPGQRKRSMMDATEEVCCKGCRGVQDRAF